MKKEDIRLFLEERYDAVMSDAKAFIKNDPIQFPRHFYDLGSDRKEVLISAIITAWFSFGNRKAILKKVEEIHSHMLVTSGSLYNYITSHAFLSYATDEKSIYRMFKGRYFYQLCCCIQEILKVYELQGEQALFDKLNHLFCFEPETYHCFGIPDTVNKRKHMLLRWLVRKDPVDMGIWRDMGTENLLIPLDTHVSNIAGMIWDDLPKAESLKKVKLITGRLKEMDEIDPVKYDFSLFSMGLEKIYPVF